jgi:hypothetical protein
MDTDIDNYSIAELLTILKLNDQVNEEKVIEKTNFFIGEYEKNDNKEMSDFFQDIQDKLLDYLENIEQNITSEENTEPILSINKQENKDYINREKTTEIPKNDKHNAMERKVLGISNNFNVAVAQDTLNPNLKNITTRMINLDSQFRQASGSDSSTDYTLDLSDPLNNTLSIRLYAFQIPFTWYTIDDSYKNCCFWITSGDISVPIFMQPGNYTPLTFVAQLNTNFQNEGFTFYDASSNIITPVNYNINNGKITMSLYGGVYVKPLYPSITFIIDETNILTFFDETATLQCKDTCIPQASLYINQTLGWLMGFRDASENVIKSGNNGSAVVDLNGPKYLILALDDYNQNHINNGLVTITELSNHLKLPNYYSPDLPYICVEGQGVGTGPIQQLVPSAPRTLTNSQIYTINSIIQNNKNNSNLKAKAPVTTDVLAIIPIKQGAPFGSIYADFSGSLQDNRRTYFGPVNIDRIHIRLLDDKGNSLNLNGAEWSVTFIAETLYQY